MDGEESVKFIVKNFEVLFGFVCDIFEEFCLDLDCNVEDLEDGMGFVIFKFY